MKKDFVEFVECNETVNRVLDYDAYKYDPARPAQWLQKICLGVLQRLGCYSYQETVAYTRHTIHLDTVFDRVLKNHQELLERNIREPHVLYIGAGTFAELMEDKVTRNYFKFKVGYKHRTPSSQYDFLGMEVHVIPWMEGVLGVPKKA